MPAVRLLAIALALSASATLGVTTATAQTVPDEALPPPATCRPGDNGEDPNGIQGRVPAAAYEDDAGLFIINCNTSLVSRHGTGGGYKVERYVDAAGNECAFYDSTIIFPVDLPAYLGVDPGTGTQTDRRDPGTYVLDMSDPANPTQTTTLVTPAFQSPHESMLLNQERGLLAAALGNPVTYPGQVELYDVSQDCTAPAFQSSLPVGVLGHESGFSPDGNTFWVASLWAPVIAAVDVSNPLVPRTLWTGEYYSHGIGISPDGTRAYLSWFKDPDVTDAGMMILDVSEVQSREPVPTVPEVSVLNWDNVSTPQMSIPVSFDGVPHLIQMDEFGLRDDVGAARIIDLSDETDPQVVGVVRLMANQDSKQEELSNDPGYSTTGGYTGHYCSVPTTVDPRLLACTFIASGLRLFDITDITRPVEVAYFNVVEDQDSPFAMSSIAFDPDDGHLWYSDGSTGFWVVDVDDSIYAPGGAVLAGTATTAPAAAPAPPSAPTAPPQGQAGALPATGGRDAGGVVAIAVVVGLGILASTRRRPTARRR